MNAEGAAAPVGVVGCGWVGLVTAAGFAEMGHRVIGIETNPDRLASLRAGEIPFHEPDLAAVLEACGERIEFTDQIGDLSDCELAFVCVGTPSTETGEANLDAVDASTAEVAALSGPSIVMKSTVPAGTGDRIRAANPETAYVSCPEFLREGSAMEDFRSPARVVVGADESSASSADLVEALYSPLGAPVQRTGLASAEMIKLASNAFLATKISFVNEIANVSEQVGADVAEVAEGMGLDPRIGAGFLNPGLGYGGSCFPKDVRALQALAGSSGYSFQLLSAVIEVNDRQKQRVMDKLTDNLGDLSGKRIALLGLSFKPGTDDMREASSIFLAHRLEEAGAEVTGYDPVAAQTAAEVLPDVALADSALAAVDQADAAVVVTEWPEFADLDWSAAALAMSGNLVIDGRNCLPADALLAAGLVIESIGRPRREGTA